MRYDRERRVLGWNSSGWSQAEADILVRSTFASGDLAGARFERQALLRAAASQSAVRRLAADGVSGIVGAPGAGGHGRATEWAPIQLRLFSTVRRLGLVRMLSACLLQR